MAGVDEQASEIRLGVMSFEFSKTEGAGIEKKTKAFPKYFSL